MKSRNRARERGLCNIADGNLLQKKEIELSYS